MVFSEGNREQVRALPGFGGKYRVGNMGHVFSKNGLLKPVGGRYVNLSEHGIVHRVDIGYLVARLFVGNPRGYAYIRRINGEMDDCRAENLEWVEHRERRGGRKVYEGRGVVQYSVDGSCVARYASLREAARESGVGRLGIKRCAEGMQQKAGGFYFRYD